MQAPECKLFVDAEISATELLSFLAHVLAESPARCEMEVFKNEDYDSNRRKYFPDGFVYFRYIIDLYMSEAAISEQIDLVKQLLEYLWDSGYAAIAASAFEAQLPEHGGYKSSNIPWAED